MLKEKISVVIWQQDKSDNKDKTNFYLEYKDRSNKEPKKTRQGTNVSSINNVNELVQFGVVKNNS